MSAHAVDFLADRLRMASGPVTLVPTGPLTNIALLLAHHPDMAADIERIVLMGGAIAEGNVTPAAEFNIWVDPEAAARVFASGIDVTMVGLDVTHRALMTAEHAERLRPPAASGRWSPSCGPSTTAPRAGLRLPGRARARRAGRRARDPRRPGAHRAPQRRGRLRLELCRGRTVVDLWQISGREPNAHVGVEVDGAAFLDLLVERIGSLG